MQAVIGALSVRLGLDSAAFDKGLSETEKRLNRFGKNLQRAARKMQRLGTQMSVGLTAPLAAIGVSATRTAGEFREAVAQVEAGLASMGNASGRTLGDLKKQADDLQGT
ncbi:MAG: hypothetical protein WBF53_12045, partial [Litorimonas sp.]